jgi:hypothetical protein
MSLTTTTRKASILEVNPLDQMIVQKSTMFIPDYVLGHEEVEWTEDDDTSLARARKIFADKLKLGWAAFKEIVKDGKKTWKSIKKFEPKADRLLLLPITKQIARGG